MTDSINLMASLPQNTPTTISKDNLCETPSDVQRFLVDLLNKKCQINEMELEIEFLKKIISEPEPNEEELEALRKENDILKFQIEEENTKCSEIANDLRKYSEDFESKSKCSFNTYLENIRQISSSLKNANEEFTSEEILANQEYNTKLEKNKELLSEFNELRGQISMRVDAHIELEVKLKNSTCIEKARETLEEINSTLLEISASSFNEQLNSLVENANISKRIFGSLQLVKSIDTPSSQKHESKKPKESPETSVNNVSRQSSFNGISSTPSSNRKIETTSIKEESKNIESEDLLFQPADNYSDFFSSMSEIDTNPS